ncbi:tRNA 2-selenouridine(34) synthase MnmH [Ammoniphilus oxalaticus]|uniref:tRNA 2-selenouridine(34) synthase MnmH n=1 Tax=Ammoniphilus oxalaticus TaxID=66863 RepID=A0A419SG35_9BACL|nr:tRNA 2-selenouridine(34) synthase MnmH [Ammoniphilus oxalaticus]RKD22740.1 tRNA 2-selenouridine(34) synthase MnmH [Ammoniphilus oxalaticus]
MKEIHIEEALTLNNPRFIDVRSPIEFMESHLPQATNIPLFTDEERVKLGTVYKQQGQATAKRLGIELLSPKIPAFIDSIQKEADKGNELVLYCWRGGMRSKTATTLAELAGLDVYRLVGGIKTYRQWTREQLNGMIHPRRFVVLHGLTGVGKTSILERLAAQGFPTLHLEACAGHRGSVFGDIGKPAYGQKTFESRLVHQLQKIHDLPYAFVEAESKRIGKVVQPDFLLEMKRKGIHIVLEATLPHRVERIYGEYVNSFLDDPMFKTKIHEAVSRIAKRCQPELQAKINNDIGNNNYKALIVTLLKEYYDPRYQHKLEEYDGPFHYVDANHLDKATARIIAIAEEAVKPLQ